ncbi:MAG: TonB family protein [Candidatus Sulfotelmatobacter sp.]
MVAFDVDESGTIRNARIKRSSGSRAADRLALAEVSRWKYKPMPGCGILEQEASVTIDFSAE